MDKLTAIKIKYDDETYSDEIPIRSSQKMSSGIIPTH